MRKTNGKGKGKGKGEDRELGFTLIVATSDISTPQNVTLNKFNCDWLFDMSVKRPHGQALVWRSGYTRLGIYRPRRNLQTFSALYLVWNLQNSVVREQKWENFELFKISKIFNKWERKYCRAIQLHGLFYGDSMWACLYQVHFINFCFPFCPL